MENLLTGLLTVVAIVAVFSFPVFVLFFVVHNMDDDGFVKLRKRNRAKAKAKKARVALEAERARLHLKSHAKGVHYLGVALVAGALMLDIQSAGLADWAFLVLAFTVEYI